MGLIPNNWVYRVVICGAWLALLAYALIHRNPIAYVVLAVITLFAVVPALVIGALTRSDRTRDAQDACAHDPPDERPA